MREEDLGIQSASDSGFIGVLGLWLVVTDRMGCDRYTG